MTKSRKAKNKPPSRERYEERNPTVSARLSIEKRDKLFSVLRRLGLSLRNLLIGVADETDIKLKPVDEAWKAGYEEAKKRHMVPYPCSVCGELLSITSPKEKESAARYMTEHGWGHAKCHERRRQL